MRVHLKRLGFIAKIGSRGDRWWWTTDASGRRVNTIIGVQTTRVPVGATRGGVCVGAVIGPLYFAFLWINKEAAKEEAV